MITRNVLSQMAYVRVKAKYFGPSKYVAGTSDAVWVARFMNAWAKLCWRYYQMTRRIWGFKK